MQNKHAETITSQTCLSCKPWFLDNGKILLVLTGQKKLKEHVFWACLHLGHGACTASLGFRKDKNYETRV